MKTARTLLAAALLLHALGSTTLFGLLQRAWTVDEDYDAFRRRHALLVPTDLLARALDDKVAPGPLVLTTRLRTDEASSQRLAEGLYPRRLEPGAALRLGLARDGALPEAAHAVLRQDDGALWYVLGEGSTPAAQTPSVSTALAFGPLGLGLLLVLALGAPAFVFFRATGVAAPAATLLGALTLGAVATLATWLDAAVAPWQLGVLGALSLLLAAAAVRGRAGWHGRLGGAELLALAALCVALGVVQLRLPQTGWDARSIWLFRAKQLALAGRVPLADLRNPYYAFSHPEYPLLFPAWLAVHSGGVPFHERMANVSIPVLFVALAWLAWAMLRKDMDRLPAAAVAAAGVLTLQRNAALGYADAHLALLLLTQALALRRRDTAPLGFLAAAAASLLKTEGLVFSLLVSALSMGLVPELRRRRLAAAAAHALGVAQLLVARWRGLSGDFPTLAFGSLESEPLTRAGTVLGAARDFLAHVPLLAEGAALGSVALVLLVAMRRTLPADARRSVALLLGAAAAFAAVVFAALLLTPRDVAWHAARSIDRLLLHPALFLTAAPFLALAGRPSAE